MLIQDTAPQLGCHRKTVTRGLQRSAAPPRRPGGCRGSKLDPYKAIIDGRLEDGVWNAAVIYRELQAAGYTGGRTIVWDYIRPKRSPQPSRATVRFQTPPGRQLQHDWGELDVTIAGVLQRIYIAVSSLGYSRRFHVFAAPAGDAEHTYESVVRAFEYFGGVAREVVVDNQKAAVVGREQGRATFHERFVDLARCYGFRPRACRPYRARTKGKVGRNIGYTKDHLFVHYMGFESFDHLNRCLEAWLAEEADPRCHGTHGEVVIERLRRDEAPALQPLPAVRFDTAYRMSRIVGWDGYVDVAGNRYSVPDDHCGERVNCHLSLDGQLTVYTSAADARVIAEHVLTDANAGWQYQSGHHTRLWRESVPVAVRDLAVYEELA